MRPHRCGRLTRSFRTYQRCSYAHVLGGEFLGTAPLLLGLVGRGNASRHPHSLAMVGGDNLPCNGRPESSSPSSLDPQAQSTIAVKHSQVGVRLAPSLPGAMVQGRGRQAHRDCPWPSHIPTRQRAHRRGPGLTLPKCFTPRGATGQRDTRKRTKNVRCAINTPKRSRHRRCAREQQRTFNVPARHVFTTQRVPGEPQSSSSSSPSTTIVGQLA